MAWASRERLLRRLQAWEREARYNYYGFSWAAARAIAVIKAELAARFVP